MIEFKLPSLGADMDEGKLLEWKVKPGDTVRKGQVVAIVDTTKAAVDVECWQEGVVHQLITKPDETIPTGTVMALLLAPGENAATASTAKPAAAVATDRNQPPSPPAATLTDSQSGRTPVQPAVRQRVSPAARKLAAELKVNLETLTSGSGPDGAIAIEDIQHAAKSATPSTSDRSTEIRRTIAAAMSRSKREIPHYYLDETIALQRASQWLGQFNAQRPMTSRVLMATLFLKAVAVTLKGFPELNGLNRDGVYRPSPAVHLGIAISLRHGGLIAPALHDTDTLMLDALMSQLADLIRRTRVGSLRSSELSDATITVTNLGEQGADTVFGVIYPPQVALVGFGRVTLRPWAAADGTLSAIPTVRASLAADHRVSDGHRGAQFLATLAQRLQQPETL